MDLSKAFDTLNHDILLGKMKCMKFSDKTIKWFKSYLNDRTFFVSIDNILSERGIINCGVPQGSILGLILFLLYRNDIPQALSKSKGYLYADDTSICYQNKDVLEIQKILKDPQTITIPRPEDQKYIISDAATKSPAFGAILLVKRKDDKTGKEELKIGGYFNLKLKEGL